MPGLGDTLTTTKDPTAVLIAEVNRFGPGAPTAFQYVAQPYQLATGNIPSAVAVSAAFIFHRRAQDAAVKFGDKGSLDLLALANSGLRDPASFVTKNLPLVTSTIRSYADANGLPASKLSIVGKVADLASSPLVLAAVGAGALLFLWTRRRR